MPYVTTQDGTNIFYKDWGSGRPIVFSHGWPLSADAWDAQMLFMVQQGFRAVAHDRRGHGRSDQPAHGNDMDTYVADLAAVMDHLDIKDAILVGHSTGGGEVARYAARHGQGRVGKLVLAGSVTPIMVSTNRWIGGTEISVFDEIRKSVATGRSSFYLELPLKVFGMNKLLSSVDEGLRHEFWRQGMQGGILGQYACVHEFSEVDFTADCEALTMPTLIVHGDADQIVPIKHSADLTVQLVKHHEMKVYSGAPHGLPFTHREKFDADLLEFARS